MAKLFKEPKNIFNWADIKTFLLRNQYNETLSLVVIDYFTKQYTSGLPNFLNANYCLTLTKFSGHCKCDGSHLQISSLKPTKWEEVIMGQKNYDEALKNYEAARKKLIIGWKIFEGKISEFTIVQPATGASILTDFANLKQAIIDSKDASNKAGSLQTALTAPVIGTNYDAKLVTELTLLNGEITMFEKNQTDLSSAQGNLTKKKNDFEKAKTAAEFDLESAKITLESANKIYNAAPNASNLRLKETADDNLKKATDAFNQLTVRNASSNTSCHDHENAQFCLPPFYYNRLLSLPTPIKDKNGNLLDINFDFSTSGLTVGAVLWLYYYERMGIFKILGALMDDYNYRGKYTITGNRKDSNGNPNGYSTLMDMVCTWHRLGMSSNLRDRICLYQRVLGVSIENNLGVESERNTGFMGTFNKLLDYMLEYYKDKRLAVAINNSTSGRSSVATQTSIKDTINLLRQQFEPFQYGRNQINTFLGIATVHATICLLYNIRKEIGVPDQYESPEEFIPATYDILVAKRSVTLNETNRFIVHDNCASYGYRLLTDLETADLAQFQPVATGGVLDLWLDDVEGWVEGYRNAYSSVSEKVEAIV
jgi:tetratricopeptide (TPR) repeat protein